MSDRLQAGQSLAQWRLHRVIGSGAHGTVYAAEHGSTGQVVALKTIDLQPADDPAAFLAGAARARTLQHPGIVATFEAGIEGAIAWLAMEAVPGSDLARYARRARLLPERVVVQLTVRIARALAHAHRLGIVHRDLKPANVLVDWPTDTVKIADLGLARAGDSTQTATGIVLGTPGYMAPEQLAGAVPTSASDFFALGTMLFELLTGRLPHEAASMGALLREVAHTPAPDPRQWSPLLPDALVRVIAELLAKRPEDRPQDGDLLAARLQQAAAGLPPSA